MASSYPDTRNVVPKEALVAPDAARPDHAPAPAAVNGVNYVRRRMAAGGGRPAGRTKVRRTPATIALTVVSCVLVAAGALLCLYGEQAPGVGAQGLIDRLVFAAGAGVFGVGMLLVLVMMGSSGALGAVREPGGTPPWRLAGVVALNILVYGGSALLILGGLAGLDDASGGTVAVVLVVWAVCAALIVLYRRHRKRHPVSYDRVAWALTPVVLVLVGGFALGGGAIQGIDVAQDALAGPRTVEARLDSWSYDYPSGRYRALRQTQVDLELTVLAAADGEEPGPGERLALSVPRAGEAALGALYGSRSSASWGSSDGAAAVLLTYYPHTGVFVDAVPVE